MLDTNATGALHMMLSSNTLSKISCYEKFDLEKLGELYVMWRNRKNVNELSVDENIPDHNKKEKLDKISFFKNAVLNNFYTDTTLLAMRKDSNSPIVITDGIHRALGINRAIIEKPDLIKKINLRLILFEGEGIQNLEDYTLSIPGER